MEQKKKYQTTINVESVKYNFDTNKQLFKFENKRT